MFLYTDKYTGLIPIDSKNMYWLPKTCKMIQGVQGVLLFGYKLSFKSFSSCMLCILHILVIYHSLNLPCVYFPTSPNYSLSQKWLHFFLFSAPQKLNTYVFITYLKRLNTTGTLKVSCVDCSHLI